MTVPSTVPTSGMCGEPVRGDVRRAGRRLHARVGGVGVHGGCDVGRERPGRGGPDDEVLAIALEQRQAHVERRVGDVLVGVDQLVLGERRAAARAPRHRAMALVEPSQLMHALEKLPDVRDVGIGHRVVRLVPVHPLPEPLGVLGQLARIRRHPLTAGDGELVEAVLLDLGLGVEPELLLDPHLDPQALAVEAVLVALIMAEHRVVALPDVLDRAAPSVVHPHRVVGGDGAVDEAELLVAAIGVAQHLEGALGLPSLERAMLQRDVVGLRRDGLKRRHARSVLMRAETGHRRTDATMAGGRLPLRNRCRCDGSSRRKQRALRGRC